MLYDLVAATGSVLVSLALLPMLLDKRTKVPVKTAIIKIAGYVLVVIGLALSGLLMSAGVVFSILLCWVLLLLLRRV